MLRCTVVEEEMRTAQKERRPLRLPGARCGEVILESPPTRVCDVAPDR